MEQANPFFSVIIPTYNRGDYILSTIESVLRQRYTEFELIVVDDGSNDNTESIVNSVNDPRIHYYKRDNRERGAARNYGIHKAIGEYVTFLDSDDLLYSNALENAFTCLQAYSTPSCFAQAYEIIEGHSQVQLYPPHTVSSKTINTRLLKGNFLSCIGVYVKREVLTQHYFDEDRRFAGTEDWLLWLQLSARFPFYYSNTLTACMVHHENRSVLNFEEQRLVYRAEYLREKLALDDVFIKVYGSKAVDRIYAHMLSYTSLHLAMCNQKKAAGKYLIKALATNINELFARRTLAITKLLLTQR